MFRVNSFGKKASLTRAQLVDTLTSAGVATQGLNNAELAVAFQVAMFQGKVAI